MTGMLGQSTLSASLLVIQNWEEWMVDQRIVLLFRETWTGWRNGLAGTS